ncbi:MAG: DUF3307 domain-containing protein [Bacteroidetes bacterium]|nr:MAG: DUF3307 domain-containing protein [Bacteroidota bacterium]
MPIDNTTFFTYEQANLLIRLMMAHVLADFVFQSKHMVDNKNWFSKPMLQHIGIVAAATVVFTFSWQLTLAVTSIHWVIDGCKCSLKRKYPERESALFFADQFAHILSIIVIWGMHQGVMRAITQTLILPFSTYNMSLVLLGYALVIWPMGYAMQFALKGIARTTNATNDENLEHGGKLIGLFERIIILTLVLLGEYSAIGFLITGKSIIRFATQGENLRSEYVLVGTMMSYALAILVGVMINLLMVIS